jgi:hypothetical protein
MLSTVSQRTGLGVDLGPKREPLIVTDEPWLNPLAAVTPLTVGALAAVETIPVAAKRMHAEKHASLAIKADLVITIFPPHRSLQAVRPVHDSGISAPVPRQPDANVCGFLMQLVYRVSKRRY